MTLVRVGHRRLIGRDCLRPRIFRVAPALWNTVGKRLAKTKVPGA